MKKKFSKAMGLRVGKLTNSLFREAINEILALDPDTSYFDAKKQLYDLMYDSNDYEKAIEKKKAADDLYLEKLLSLTSAQLQEIMIVHNEGVIKRAPRTIEAIVSEIARRSIFDDSKESDPRCVNGDVDELIKSSKRSSKKTTTKRNKATKNRSTKRVR